MKASEKIDAILAYLGISAATFATALGYARPQIIYDIQRGKTKGISGELAIKIVSVYPNISKSWLLASEGEMLKSTNGSTIVQNIEQSNISGDNNNATNTSNKVDEALLAELAEQRKLVQVAQEQVNQLIAIIQKMQEGK